MESTLTKRQLQILQAMHDGYRKNRQIAEHLGISVHSVEMQLQLAYIRTGIHKRWKLLHAAIKNDWLSQNGESGE